MARKRIDYYYRCKSCHSPVPTRYNQCGTCGNDRTVITVNTVEELTREYHNARQAAAHSSPGIGK